MTNNQTLLLYMGCIMSSFILCTLAINSKYYKNTRSVNLKILNSSKQVVFNHSWLVVISLLPLILLAGFRYYTGADYQQYVWSFERTASSNTVFNEYFLAEEPLYQISKYLVFKLLGNDPIYWFFVMATLTMINIAYANINLDSHISINWFILMFGLFCYLHMFNYVRQIYAASIVLIGISKLIRKEKLPFVICILIATMVHRSSMLFIVLLIIIHFQDSVHKPWYKIVMMISPFFMPVIVALIKLIPFFSRYTQYFNVKYQIGFGWLIDVFPIICIALIVEYKMNPDNNIRALIDFSWLVIPLRAISYYAYAAGRLYLDISLAAFMALALALSKSDRRNIGTKVLILLVFVVYFLLEFYLWNNSEVFPYRSIWR